ncbi:MAG TPA: BON domain-containing protein, partial [Albitalea sp.]|nr:BON domain-containing protein [Albitalea sp.]
PFDDPFVPATQGRASPAPRGPAYTEAQRRQEAHNRVERGTSCWLAGTCSEPNAYRYDAGIAVAVVSALRSEASLAGTSIWVIAERRFVYLQGCVGDAAQAAHAEAIAKAARDVQIVIPALSLPGETPRYPLAAARR